MTQVLCVGPKATAKTTSAAYITDIARFDNLHNQEELTPTVLNQLGTCGAFPMVIDDVDRLGWRIKNTLKVVLTGTTKRRRSTTEGGRRDAPEFVRTLCLTMNHIAKWISDLPALLDRSLIINFEEVPQNNESWKEKQRAFDNCKSSVLNWLSRQEWGWEAFINESESEAAAIIQNKPRKQGILSFLIFGLKILEKMGLEFEYDDVIEEFKKLILRSNTKGERGNLNKILSFLNDCNRRYKAFVDFTAGGQDPDREERLRQYGLCEVRKDADGDEWFVVGPDLINKMHRNGIDITKQSELKQIIDAAGLHTKQKRVWRSHKKSTDWCLLIEKIEFNADEEFDNENEVDANTLSIKKSRRNLNVGDIIGKSRRRS